MHSEEGGGASAPGAGSRRQGLTTACRELRVGVEHEALQPQAPAGKGGDAGVGGEDAAGEVEVGEGRAPADVVGWGEEEVGARGGREEGEGGWRCWASSCLEARAARPRSETPLHPLRLSARSAGPRLSCGERGEGRRVASQWASAQ